MSATTISTTVQVTVPDEDIIVLCEMARYGLEYWAETATVDKDARTYTVTLDAEAREDDDLPPFRALHFDWLAKRLVQLGTGYLLEGVSGNAFVRTYAASYVASALAGVPDAGDIDADLADVVVQLAYLGKVMFG